jgi:hypothetical protein
MEKEMCYKGKKNIFFFGGGGVRRGLKRWVKIVFSNQIKISAFKNKFVLPQG